MADDVREHLIRDQRHSFIQNHSRSSDSPLLLFSSLTHLLQGSGQRTPDTRSEDHSFIQNHSRSSDSQLLLFSSPHSSSTGFRSENTRHEIRDHSFIQNHSRSSDSQLLLFSSPHSSSTGFRSENTWHEIRDHSFIQNLSRSSDSQLLLFSSPHSSSTGFRSENTWHEIRDHSFIQNLSRSSDSQLLLFSSPHSSFYRVQFRRTPDNEIRDHSFIQNHSRSSDSQRLLFSSLTHLLQGSVQRTPDTRSRPFLHPESLQIFRFTASSLQFTHSSSTRVQVRDTWHEIRDRSFIQNHSRSSDTPLLLFSSLTHLLQGSDQRTPDTRSETVPSSRITPDLQIHSFFSSVHSLIFYMVQVREHLTRDQRPFLHPESLQIFRFTASSLQFTHSSSTGFSSENTWHEIRDHSFIQNHSRSSDSQLLLFSSLTHLLQVQVREHLIRDQRPFLHPESLQIFRFTASSLQFTHSSSTGFRSENTWHGSETIPSSRITPDLQIHSIFSSVHLTHLLYRVQIREHLTRDQRSIPSSRITPDLQIHIFFSSVHLTIFYRVQVREHLTRDQRPFLHPESLHIFRFTASPLQFTHSSSTGFRSENTWHEIRDHSFIQNLSRSDSSQLLLFSSPHSSSTGFRSENTWHEIRDHSFIQNLSRSSDSQLLLFSSPHSSSTGFRSENTWHEIRDHSFIQNHSRSSDSPLLLFSSPHSSSTGFRSDNTWPEIRDHSFIQNHSRSSDSQHLLFSSPHSSSTGFRSENTWYEIRDHSFIQNHSRSDSQLLLFSSLTHLLQGSVR